MTADAPRSDRPFENWLTPAVALTTGALLLGPALAPGVVVAYDMPWSPTPRLTPFALGIGTPAPRAVPGDAVITMLGMALGAGLAQGLVLLGMLVAASLGAVRLMRLLAPTAGPAIGTVTAVAAIWNPFVVERLAIGQWVVLLGYAVTPWALGAGLRWWSGNGTAAALAGCLAVASLGGANPWVMVGAVAIPAVLGRPRPGAILGILAVLVGTAAVWAVPALTAGADGDAAGVDAFAPRADTPFGTVLSLVSGGGFWNAASWPSARSQPLLAGAALVLALACATAVLRRVFQDRRLLGTLLVPTLIVAVGTVPAARVPWALLAEVPGGGLLRDSQKFLAAWVIVLAVGAGMLAEAVSRSGRTRATAGPLVAALALAPVAVLPTVVWGLEGRLRAVVVPEDLERAVMQLSKAPAGKVGLLPWNQYRRYDWNADRISLTILPRMVNQVVVFDDSLPLVDGRVPGEDPVARAVSEAIAGGTPPVDALLRANVGYLAIERGAGLDTLADEAAAAGMPVIADTPHLLVVEAPRASPLPDPQLTDAQRAGWGLTLGTWFLVGLMGVGRVSQKWLRTGPYSLVRLRS